MDALNQYELFALLLMEFNERNPDELLYLL
jgi:hypothetical protein